METTLPHGLAPAAVLRDHALIDHEADAAVARRLEWILRLGACACFIGHGAFGIITKSAWLPYFAVAGIGPELAYRIMPVIGTVDLLAGILALVAPTPIALLYMIVWASWTAMLRPLAGEPVYETIERAGNYGVPLALLLLLGVPRTWAGWFRPWGRERAAHVHRSIPAILRWTTGLLLFGHGALAAITAKAMFTTHYAAIGLPATTVSLVGQVEMAAAALVLAWPNPLLLIAIAIWKLVTEALFPISGSPIWEYVERGGSYAAPLALALWLLAPRRAGPISVRTSR
jgi:hypothetical protein